MPFDTSCSPYHFSKEGIEGTEEESDEGTQSHERIHVGGTMLELLPCRDIEHATAIHHIQEGENQGYLVVESRGVAIHHHTIAHRGGVLHTERYPAHGERHHENREEPRQKGLALQESKFTAIDFLSTTVGLYDEVIACIGNLPFHIFEGNLLWVIIYKGGASCQGNRSGIYALKGIELALHIGRAY